MEREMKRTNNCSYLVVVDGQDRTGKDTLIDWIISNNQDNFIKYLQSQCDDEKVDYRDESAFSNFVRKCMNLAYETIRSYHDDEPEKYIVTSRLWISDNVYSKLFWRKPVSEKLVRADFEDLFNGKIINIVLIWDSWEDFVDRMKRIKQFEAIEEYTQEEFLKTKELFEKEAERNNAKIIRVKSKTTPFEVYEQFTRIMCSIY